MNCPHCQKDNPLYTTVEGETNPEIGDISFCIGCGEIAKFTLKGLQKLDLTALSDEERKDVLDIRTGWLKINNIENIKSEK